MKKFLKEEAGISAVIAALVMTAVLIFAALALDIGSAYIEASNAQNAADAIAMSIGRYLPIEQNNQIKKAILYASAADYARKNGIYNFKIQDIQLTNLESGSYKTATVRVSRTSYTKLARIIGVASIDVRKSAKVSSVPVGELTGGVPIGITEEAYDTAIRTGNTKHIPLKVGGGDGTNGFYGFIVLDESNGNATILEKWLKYGYDGFNEIGQLLPVATGNKTSTARDSVYYRMGLCNHYVGLGGCTTEHYNESCGRIVYILIYRFIDERTVKIVGFAPFLIEWSDQLDVIQGSFINMNVSYTDKTSDKDCGTYTYKLTE